MAISLPTGETNKGTNDWSDVYGNDKALKEAAETLEGKFPVTTANLSGEITDAKLASPNNSFYRTLLFAQQPCRLDLAAGTYIFGGEETVASGGEILGTNAGKAGVSSIARFIYFAKADYEVAGKTQKLRLRAQAAVNATKPTIKFTVGLYPITVAGGTDILTMTLGTVVASSTAEINEPAASTVTQKEATDFTIPADGAYALGVVTSGTLTNNSAVLLSAQLQTRST